MPVYHPPTKSCGPECRLKDFTKVSAHANLAVSTLVPVYTCSTSQNTVAAYMWDVHCNTPHLIHIATTSVDGRAPSIMTVRWNDVVQAPTTSLYMGSDWSTNIVWRGDSVVQPNITYRFFHLRQQAPSALLNETFMIGMLHCAGKWYGNVCAVVVLPDKSVRHMKVSDLILMRCAFSRYVVVLGVYLP